MDASHNGLCDFPHILPVKVEFGAGEALLLFGVQNVDDLGADGPYFPDVL